MVQYLKAYVLIDVLPCRSCVTNKSISTISRLNPLAPSFDAHNFENVPCCFDGALPLNKPDFSLCNESGINYIDLENDEGIFSAKASPIPHNLKTPALSHKCVWSKSILS